MSVQPVIEASLARERLDAKVELAGQENDKLLLQYPALAQGTGYVPPVVTLEFGGRATGEPHEALQVVCDMDGPLPDVSFPTATPLVMSVARTFWEKATAAHVYCAQARIRGERYARHWHDLAWPPSRAALTSRASSRITRLQRPSRGTSPASSSRRIPKARLSTTSRQHRDI
jgi:hypothetical protein